MVNSNYFAMVGKYYKHMCQSSTVKFLPGILVHDNFLFRNPLPLIVTFIFLSSSITCSQCLQVQCYLNNKLRTSATWANLCNNVLYSFVLTAASNLSKAPCKTSWVTQNLKLKAKRGNMVALDTSFK